MRDGRLGLAVRLALIVCVAAFIHRGRGGLVEQYSKLRVLQDIYVLPKPEQTVLASLGYRSALADIIYAHVLVSCGLHFQEKRRFEFVGNFLETINELDPKFRDPYRFADTVLTLQAQPPLLEDYRKARQILQRGLRELPYDGELWVTAGQYVAYLAIAHLETPEEKAEWRLTGARWLTHACELVGDSKNLPYHCVTAAGLLSRAGEQAAMVEFVKRVLAVSDDENLRRLALRYLENSLSERERASVAARDKRFSVAAAEDARFISKELLLLLGPRIDTPRCVGRRTEDAANCVSSWKAWGVGVSAGAALEGAVDAGGSG